MTASIPRPASTVVLLRRSGAAFEVFLVRRHDNVAFMGGAHVFPGGRVDEDDRAAPVDGELSETVRQAMSRMPGIDIGEAVAYYAAAARELREEAGVSLSPATLTPFARWVTPDIEIKRFDALFFVAVMPEGQDAVHCGSETTAGLWLTPEDAIAECRAERIALPPPTWTTLRQLERIAHTARSTAAVETIDAVLAWARTRLIAPIQPRVIERDGGKVLTLPGDPDYPALAHFETPAETRFLFAHRRWTPVTSLG